MATTTTTNNSSGNNNKRRVSFNERVRCKFSLHHNDFTEEERIATWMTREEMMATRDDIRSTILDIQAGKLPMQRGLEFRTKAASKRRAALKNEARAVVLDEQSDQRREGDCDVQYMAEMYAEVCEGSQRQAGLRGMLDEQVARQLNSLKGDDDTASTASSSYLSLSSISEGSQVPETESVTGSSQSNHQNSTFPSGVSPKKRLPGISKLSQLLMPSSSSSSPSSSSSSSMMSRKTSKPRMGPIRLLVGKAA
eukprot:CAMPEP_0198109296 /NCGR_PEP_ID=MMETSP1442-20131203/1315_1 /TAXON_ID= /ORGANISM="Craspedostauros australis, Strain CCMP3328" /LENGTH=251 /DNA_ID=CAMNT_0043764881 /DNA_START=62 /DNA_END=817 /DNA_ORIENTATION=+